MRKFIDIITEQSNEIEYKILTGSEMLEYFKSDESVLKRIKYLTYSEIKKEIHIVAFIENYVIGVAGLEINPYNNKQIWAKHISVDPLYSGRGIGRKLTELVYQYSKDYNFKLILSSFSDEGEQKLKHITQELSESYLQNNETKFWFKNNFLFHDINNHHIKFVIDNYTLFGLTYNDISVHPYSNIENIDWDEVDEDELDNDDMGIFDMLFHKGWVRGGHFIDTMSYHEFNEIRPDDKIYLQGYNIRSLRKCVSQCILKWPEVNAFDIETENKFLKLTDFDETNKFIKFGVL